MTFVKIKNQNTNQRFNNFMDDFFYGFPSLYKDYNPGSTTKSSAPVNIKKTESGYELELVAPGFAKEDFKIDLDNNLLMIAVEKQQKDEESKESYIRREFNYNTFKRSFTLNENIDAANISAQYVNGILTLNLPNKAEVKSPAKQITVQ